MTRTSMLRRALSGQHRLARRLILHTVLFSGVIALVISALQVAIEYQRDIDDIEQRFDVIEKSYLPSIVESAWLLDREQLGTLLAGIERLPDFDYAEVRFRGGVLAASGTRANVMGLERHWNLSRRYRRSDVGVGELTVQASLAGPRGRILDRFTFIVLANTLKTLLVAAFMFLFVWWLITRHVERVAAHVAHTDPTVPVPTLRLDRTPVDPPDELDRLVLALNTMAEQVRASHDTIRRARSLLSAVVNSSPDRIFAKDLEHRYLLVNEAFAASRNFAARDIIGRRDTDICLAEECEGNPALGIPGLHQEDRDAFSGKTVRRPDLRLTLPNGEVRYFDTIKGPLRDEDGRIFGALGYSRDVTDRTRAEAALKELNEQLEHRVRERTAQLESAIKELETFTYSVSHDLKAPLRGIDGYSQLLLEEYSDKLDDQGRQFLRNVREATRQMDQLTNDLLAYSRLERQDVRLRQVDPRSLVEALLVEHAAGIQARGVAVSVAVPAAPVSADREGLTMALRNLLENALKFTRDTPNPAIEVGGRDGGDSCILWVRDNGVGFDMKYHDRIFAIFQRLHRAERYPGTGVGLAIVRKAMERMGGRAWAESEPGKGATFYLEIPK